jgi:hypothetical protein
MTTTTHPPGDKTMTLQAAVGPDGSFVFWMTIDTPAKVAHAVGLVAAAPGRWRIVA